VGSRKDIWAVKTYLSIHRGSFLEQMEAGNQWEPADQVHLDPGHDSLHSEAEISTVVLAKFLHISRLI